MFLWKWSWIVLPRIWSKLTAHTILLAFLDHCDDADDKSSFEATREPTIGILNSVLETPLVSGSSSEGKNKA